MQQYKKAMTEAQRDIIKKAIAYKRSSLVSLLHKGKITDSFHKGLIAKYIERHDIPSKPQNIRELTKQFLCSACSYSVTRKQLTKINRGEVPFIKDYPLLMSKLFSDKTFLNHSAWEPTNLKSLAEKLQARHNFNLNSKTLKPRTMAILLTGSEQIRRVTEHGLDPFYEKVDWICKQGGNEMWKYATEFSKPIKNVGVALACDFLKEIGFVRFVKIDFHMLAEIPKLLGQDRCSAKSLFIKTQEVADKLNMTPFHLDKLLYVWGWTRSKIKETN